MVGFVFSHLLSHSVIKPCSCPLTLSCAETSSDPLEGCSQRGDKRKASDAAEAPSKKRRLEPAQDRTKLSEEEQREQFHGKYEQQHKLGVGGCGSVFAGRRKSDDLPVAIKHIPKDNVPCKHVDHNREKLSIEVAAMLRIQAATAGLMGTSAPISLLDWYDMGQELILVLERPVPSEDLFDYVVGNGGLLEEEAKIIVKQLVDAAIDLEDKGIFHRDIKCENILIETGSEVPRVRLIDFGLSCFAKKRSCYRKFYGTHDHAPPEWYCRRTYRAGPTTVYQVGIVLFVMTHRVNFETTMYFGERVQISDKVSKDCRDFLEKCFTLVPEHRPKLRELLHHPWLR
ncbi:serine/threonine-protein kinase pim-1-like [Acanthochromis polyacanthus]|uniref:serine/threonine-protein kinase pim-1-like n=1 Tax=Acanthochromis polyacanthus TaxID=80966 RepID=UPI002234CD05|nr:serine/threonine-protein kinase pim-1-like [Acanthochromis polyacanthus]